MARKLCAPRNIAELKAVVCACGLANVVALAALVPLSYGLAPVTPYGLRAPKVNGAFRTLLGQIETVSPTVGRAARDYVFDSVLVTQRAVRAVSYALPLLVATAAFVVVVTGLRANLSRIDESTVALLFRFAIAGAVVSFFAYPIFTHDIWLSVVWGRMIVDGRNPYYVLFTSEDVGGLPLDHYPTLMTYGPLWAIIAAGVSALSRQHPMLNFILLKLIFVAVWVLCLRLIGRTLADSPADRALAMCVFGWLPGSVQLSIGEAHNDVVMVFFLLVWLGLLARGQHRLSPLALAASVLIKYVTAPLALLEVADVWVRKPITWRAYAGALCVTSVVSLGAFAAFWAGPAFFDRLVAESRGYWVFFTPVHALFSLAALVNLPLPWALASFIARSTFAVVVLYATIRYLRERQFQQVAELALALMCAVLLTGIGHVYPWFVLWVLAPAAVAIRSRLLRLIVPVAIVAPFANLYWLLASGPEQFHYGSVAFYAVVSLLMVLMWRTAWIPWGDLHTVPGCDAPTSAIRQRG